jgi:hypothetical protein
MHFQLPVFLSLKRDKPSQRKCSNMALLSEARGPMEPRVLGCKLYVFKKKSISLSLRYPWTRGFTRWISVLYIKLQRRAVILYFEYRGHAVFSYCE